MCLGERHPPLPAQTKLTREASAPSVQCTGAKPPNLHTRSTVREGLPAESDGLSKRPLTQVHKGTTRGKAHTPIPPGAIAPPLYVYCCTPLPLFSLCLPFCVSCVSPRHRLLREPADGEGHPVSGKLVVRSGQERRRRSPRQRRRREGAAPWRDGHLQVVHRKDERRLLVLGWWLWWWWWCCSGTGAFRGVQWKMNVGSLSWYGGRLCYSSGMVPLGDRSGACARSTSVGIIV